MELRGLETKFSDTSSGNPSKASPPKTDPPAVIKDQFPFPFSFSPWHPLLPRLGIQFRRLGKGLEQGLKRCRLSVARREKRLFQDVFFLHSELFDRGGGFRRTRTNECKKKSTGKETMDAQAIQVVCAAVQTSIFFSHRKSSLFNSRNSCLLPLSLIVNDAQQNKAISLFPIPVLPPVANEQGERIGFFDPPTPLLAHASTCGCMSEHRGISSLFTSCFNANDAKPRPGDVPKSVVECLDKRTQTASARPTCGASGGDPFILRLGRPTDRFTLLDFDVTRGTPPRIVADTWTGYHLCDQHS